MVLKKIVDQIGICPVCQEKVTIENMFEKGMGYAHNLRSKCTSCSWETACYSSETIKSNQSKGRSFHEVNLRAGIAFREIGKGHQGMQNFSRVMNMHSIASNAFDNIQEKIFLAYEAIAEKSMAGKAAEIREKSKKLDSDPSIAICQVSLDGTWQKRGI